MLQGMLRAVPWFPSRQPLQRQVVLLRPVEVFLQSAAGDLLLDYVCTPSRTIMDTLSKPEAALLGLRTEVTSEVIFEVLSSLALQPAPKHSISAMRRMYSEMVRLGVSRELVQRMWSTPCIFVPIAGENKTLLEDRTDGSIQRRLDTKLAGTFISPSHCVIYDESGMLDCTEPEFVATGSGDAAFVTVALQDGVLCRALYNLYMERRDSYADINDLFSEFGMLPAVSLPVYQEMVAKLRARPPGPAVNAAVLRVMSACLKRCPEVIPHQRYHEYPEVFTLSAVLEAFNIDCIATLTDALVPLRALKYFAVEGTYVFEFILTRQSI